IVEEFQLMPGQEGLQGGAKAGEECLEVAPPRLICFPGEAGKLQIPCLKLGKLEAPVLEQEIALDQALGRATPMKNEIMFHVEHSPIQEAAALLGAALQELKSVRVKQLQGKNARKLQPAPLLLAIDLK